MELISAKAGQKTIDNSEYKNDKYIMHFINSLLLTSNIIYYNFYIPVFMHIKCYTIASIKYRDNNNVLVRIIVCLFC